MYDDDFWDVINPNSHEHDAAFKAQGFQYFIDLCETCNAVVWAGFPDGRVGAGVAKEVASFEGRTVHITELDRDCTPWYEKLPKPDRIMTVDETRALIKELRG